MLIFGLYCLPLLGLEELAEKLEQEGDSVYAFSDESPEGNEQSVGQDSAYHAAADMIRAWVREHSGGRGILTSDAIPDSQIAPPEGEDPAFDALVARAQRTTKRQD